MFHLKTFVFNPFQENTYILWDETKEAVIIDAGCYTDKECQELAAFVEKEGLSIKLLLNTHAHIDHILGNYFIKETYKVPLYLNKEDLPVFVSALDRAAYWGFPNYQSVEVDIFIEEGEKIVFGNTSLKVLFVPGHAPGHVAFWNEEEKALFSGDVIFAGGGYGRYDFPFCNREHLLESIQQLCALPPETRVFTGHGNPTTISKERSFHIS